MRDESEWPHLLAGSALVIAGSSIAGLFSFEGRVPVVFVGFCLFTIGYFLARDGWGILSPVEHPVRTAELSLHTEHPLVRSAVGLVGIYGIAAGVTQFSLTVIDPTVVGAVRAGMYTMGGYAWAHVIIHQSLL